MTGFAFGAIASFFIVINLLFSRHPAAEPVSFLTIVETVLPHRKLYVDFLDLNSPLTYAYHIPAVRIASLLPASSQTVLRIYTLALAVGFLSAYRYLLRRIWNKDMLTADAILVVTAAKILLPDWSFAQREYLISLAVWLYAFAFFVNTKSSGQPGRLLLFLSGLVMGISVHFKLFYALIPLSLIAVESIRKRGIAPITGVQSLGFFMGLAGCGVISFWLYPSYFTHILPLAWKTYPYYKTLFEVRTVPELYLLLWLLALYCLVKTKQKYIFFVTIWTGVLSFLIAVLQKKGFSYHFFPSNMSLLIAIMTCLCMWRKTNFHSSRRNQMVIASISFAVVLICYILPLYRAVSFGPSVEKYLKELSGVFDSAGCRSYAALGTTVYRQNNLFSYSCVRHDFAYPNFWMLPGFYKDHTGARFEDNDYHSVAAMGSDEKIFFDTVISDLQRTKPDYVLIDVAESKAGFRAEGFDYVQYFSQDNRFVGFLRGYMSIRKTGDFEIYKKTITFSK